MFKNSAISKAINNKTMKYLYFITNYYLFPYIANDYIKDYSNSVSSSFLDVFSLLFVKKNFLKNKKKDIKKTLDLCEKKERKN